MELYTNFYEFFKIAAQTQNPKTLGAPHGQPALRLTGGAHGPAAHQPESRPTRGLDPRRGAARARRGSDPGVARVARYARMRVRGDGERQRREAA